jgi:hypothetical protein
MLVHLFERSMKKKGQFSRASTNIFFYGNVVFVVNYYIKYNTNADWGQGTPLQKKGGGGCYM